METAITISPPSRLLNDSIQFAGGRLCLDFMNTACEIRGTPVDFIADEASLSRWLQAAEAIHGKASGRWSRRVDRTSLSRAYELRNAVNDLIRAAVEGRAPSEAALHGLNAVLAAAPSERLEFVEGAFRRSVDNAQARDPWLAEIARDAVDLLCHADLSLLRKCGCETCIRVFLDSTKNHKRRWCVEKCGSRVKAANYYQRKRLRSRIEGDSPKQP